MGACLCFVKPSVPAPRPHGVRVRAPARCPPALRDDGRVNQRSEASPPGPHSSCREGRDFNQRPCCPTSSDRPHVATHGSRQGPHAARRLGRASRTGPVGKGKRKCGSGKGESRGQRKALATPSSRARVSAGDPVQGLSPAPGDLGPGTAPRAGRHDLQGVSVLVIFKALPNEAAAASA